MCRDDAVTMRESSAKYMVTVCQVYGKCIVTVWKRYANSMGNVCQKHE